MWLGEQISERGIGNGISLIIFAGIVVNLPHATFGLWRTSARQRNLFAMLGLIVFMVAWCLRGVHGARAATHPCSTPSAWWAARSTAARTPTCRCASTPPAHPGHLRLVDLVIRRPSPR